MSRIAKKRAKFWNEKVCPFIEASVLTAFASAIGIVIGIVGCWGYFNL